MAPRRRENGAEKGAGGRPSRIMSIRLVTFVLVQVIDSECNLWYYGYLGHSVPEALMFA